MAKNIKKKHSAVWIVLLVILVLLIAALVGGYLVIAGFFKTHFFPQTSINGFDASMTTAETVDEMIRAEAEDYVLAVHDR